MTQSRRTLFTTIAGFAAAAVGTPALAGDGPKAIQLADAHTAAPNFIGITRWFNSAPLSIGELRGRVVLVDFWTYGCYRLRQYAALRDKALRPIQGQGPGRGRRPYS